MLICDLKTLFGLVTALFITLILIFKQHSSAVSWIVVGVSQNSALKIIIMISLHKNRASLTAQPQSQG